MELKEVLALVSSRNLGRHVLNKAEQTLLLDAGPSLPSGLRSQHALISFKKNIHAPV